VDVEVVSGQIRDELAVFVGDDSVEADDVDGDAKTRRVGGSRLVRGPTEPSR
jgi:hypothetical protein